MSDTTRIEKIQLLKEKLDRINSEIKRRCHPLSETPLRLDRHMPPDIPPGAFHYEPPDKPPEHLIHPSHNYHAVLELKRKRAACHEEIERLIDEGLSSTSTPKEPVEKPIPPLSESNPASQKPAKKKTTVDYSIGHAKIEAERINERRIKDGKGALTRRKLAEWLLKDAIKHDSPLAACPLWKLEKNLKGICPRGKPKSR